jgi:hypothetical protein
VTGLQSRTTVRVVYTCGVTLPWCSDAETPLLSALRPEAFIPSTSTFIGTHHTLTVILEIPFPFLETTDFLSRKYKEESINERPYYTHDIIANDATPIVYPTVQWSPLIATSYLPVTAACMYLCFFTYPMSEKTTGNSGYSDSPHAPRRC